MCPWMHTCMFAGVRLVPQTLCFYPSLPYSLETGSLTVPEAKVKASKPKQSSVSTLYNAGVTGTCISTPSFLCVRWAFEFSSSCLLSKRSHPLTHVPSPTVESFNKDICRRTLTEQTLGNRDLTLGVNF